MIRMGQCLVSGAKRVIVDKQKKYFLLDEKKYPDTLSIVASMNDARDLAIFLREVTASKDAKELSGLEETSLLRCIDPPEVWACGVTYKRQAQEHDGDIRKKTNKTDDLYNYVYANKRVEVFFKGFARTTSGPDEPLFLRTDSEQTLPEAELVLVMGGLGNPIAFTIGNDMTAWDLERECPLYLNQAKIWDRSGSLGAWLIPTSEYTDTTDVKLSCRVLRNEKQILYSEGSTSEMKRTFKELCHYLMLNNTVPTGSALFTGTACVIEHDFTLLSGDVVEVASEEFGVLRNPIQIWNRD